MQTEKLKKVSLICQYENANNSREISLVKWSSVWSPSKVERQKLNILQFAVLHPRILKNGYRGNADYLQVSCNFRVKQRCFDVMEEECCNSLPEPFQIMRFDSSHHEVNFSVDQLQDLLGQFTCMFLNKTQKQRQLFNITEFIFENPSKPAAKLQKK